MANERKQAEWLGRPIASEDHASNLEREAALGEFGNHLPRGEAEEKAYQEYKKEQHARAAAHHLSGMRAAQASGNNEEARKHGAMYDLHVKALGHDAIGPVPHDVEHYAKEDDKGPYQFKNHGADSFVVEKKEDVMLDMKKSEDSKHEGESTPHEGPSCPMCQGAAEHLGGLGSRSHHRCRDCGVGFSVDHALAHAPSPKEEHQKSEEPLTEMQLLLKTAKLLLNAGLAKNGK